jgi:hypothetical protein
MTGRDLREPAGSHFGGVLFWRMERSWEAGAAPIFDPMPFETGSISFYKAPLSKLLTV